MTEITPIAVERIQQIGSLKNVAAQKAQTSGAANFKDVLSNIENAPKNLITQKLSAAKQFEAVFIGQMVGEMMPKDSGYFGEGFAGEMWHSMMSEKLAEVMVKRSDFGLAQLVEKQAPDTDTQ